MAYFKSCIHFSCKLFFLHEEKRNKSKELSPTWRKGTTLFPYMCRFFSCVQTLLESVAQREEGQGGWDPVQFMPMLCSGEMQQHLIDRCAQPTVFPQHGHSSQKPGVRGPVWQNRSRGLLTCFYLFAFCKTRGDIKIQNKLQLLIISPVIRKNCSQFQS